MDLYSGTLLVALLAAPLALVAGVVTRLSAQPRSALSRTGTVAGALAVGFAVTSVTYHLSTGHRPGTPAALTIAGFIAEHPAPFAAIVVGASAIWLARQAGPGRD